MPKYLAAFTRANSSGDDALYFSVPSEALADTIVWQTARILINFSSIL